MKNTKVARIRQNIVMLKQQFLQRDTGLFDPALGEHEIGAAMRARATHTANASIPRWTRCACS